MPPKGARVFKCFQRVASDGRASKAWEQEVSGNSLLLQQFLEFWTVWVLKIGIDKLLRAHIEIGCEG